jgi:hypothetical protein
MATTEFVLTIACDNSAFDDDVRPELAHILRVVTNQIERGREFNEPVPVYDTNGNRVGNYVLK